MQQLHDMCAPAPSVRRRVRFSVWGIGIFAVAVLLLLSACDTSGGGIAGAKTSTVTGSTLLSTPTPIPISTEAGWHAVLHLSNTSVPGATQSSAGTFMVTNPYAVLARCSGSGKIVISFTPQGSFSPLCNQPPQVVQFAHVGSSDHPPQHQDIQLAVDSQTTGSWEVLVEVQN